MFNQVLRRRGWAFTLKVDKKPSRSGGQSHFSPRAPKNWDSPRRYFVGLLFCAAALATTSLPAEEKPNEIPIEKGTFIINGSAAPGAEGVLEHVFIINKGEPSEYWLGINCYSANDTLRSQLKLADDVGLVVAEVTADSPAAKAGVKQHDVLTAIGDKDLKDLVDLISSLNESKEKQVTLKLMRGGQPLSIEVTPTKRPAEDHLIKRPSTLSTKTFRFVEDKAQGAPGGNMRYYVFGGPGMVLPPGAGVHPPLPEDMSINVNKQGDKPAEITIKRGDKSWTTTEDALDKLPEEIRGHVAGVLGVMSPDMMTFDFKIRDPGAAGATVIEKKAVVKQVKPLRWKINASDSTTPTGPKVTVEAHVEERQATGAGTPDKLEAIVKVLQEQNTQLQRLADEMKQMREEMKQAERR